MKLGKWTMAEKGKKMFIREERQKNKRDTKNICN